MSTVRFAIRGGQAFAFPEGRRSGGVEAELRRAGFVRASPLYWTADSADPLFGYAGPCTGKPPGHPARWPTDWEGPDG